MIAAVLPVIGEMSNELLLAPGGKHFKYFFWIGIWDFRK